MGFINLAEKTIQAKLVYYGVGMGGKTTSLQAVHGIMCPRNEVQLVSINTEEDATLLFDFLPINLGLVEGFKIKIQGFTVPGQPKYRLMRKYVLSGADAVVFVVDSDRSRLEENKAAWNGLMDNLRLNGIQPEKIPLILQYNKRDLDDILSEQELDDVFLTREGMASFPSVATDGQGVFEAFVHATSCLVETKVRQYGLGRGEIDPESVAQAAGDKLWEMRAEARGVDLSERGPSTELTVLDDDLLADGAAAEDAGDGSDDLSSDFGDDAAVASSEAASEDDFGGLGVLDQLADAARDFEEVLAEAEDGVGRDAVDEDPPLEYELRDEAFGGGEVLSDADLDLDLTPSVHGDGGDAPARRPIPLEALDEDERLLDKTVQSNVELAERFGELDQYRALLERRIDELVNVAQNTVHDLNRPLSAIKLMLGSLDKGFMGALEPKGHEAVGNGLQAVRQMERLIGDLLDSSRLDHDGVQMNFEAVAMSDLVGDVVERLHYELDQVGGVVHIEPLPEIQADAWALTKVFTNILGNAIQYSHPERNPTIHVSARQDGDQFVFAVADNGIGIPEEDRERLFRRFERGSNTGGVSGTGLGLHIIREVVLGHGGQVWVESEVGLGTVFYIALPMEPVQPPHSQVTGVAEHADL